MASWGSFRLYIADIWVRFFSSEDWGLVTSKGDNIWKREKQGVLVSHCHGIGNGVRRSSLPQREKLFLSGVVDGLIMPDDKHSEMYSSLATLVQRQTVEPAWKKPCSGQQVNGAVIQSVGRTWLLGTPWRARAQGMSTARRQRYVTNETKKNLLKVLYVKGLAERWCCFCIYCLKYFLSIVI